MTRQSDTQENGFWSARLILSLVLTAAALIFVFSNVHSVPIIFFGITLTLPMWIWFAVLLAVGITIGWMRPGSRRQRPRGRR
ncbi:hypothetical protein [Microbacterium stercoris]|uniref:LapA family protein n=1 Tax=Microbacterium stercoris TaxID=2820289 RepID=A0A939QHV8_9MICO|nr:hypothetical protein [Microbacterium stercoris]MBO3662345.1 hypothetical protein [Microbacterium stercoris]MBO3664337.1 hypothetical protein [Microbacterium stercoris]